MGAGAAASPGLWALWRVLGWLQRFGRCRTGRKPQQTRWGAGGWGCRHRTGCSSAGPRNGPPPPLGACGVGGSHGSVCARGYGTPCTAGPLVCGPAQGSRLTHGPTTHTGCHLVPRGAQRPPQPGGGVPVPVPRPDSKLEETLSKRRPSLRLCAAVCPLGVHGRCVSLAAACTAHQTHRTGFGASEVQCPGPTRGSSPQGAISGQASPTSNGKRGVGDWLGLPTVQGSQELLAVHPPPVHQRVNALACLDSSALPLWKSQQPPQADSVHGLG